VLQAIILDFVAIQPRPIAQFQRVIPMRTVKMATQAVRKLIVVRTVCQVEPRSSARGAGVACEWQCELPTLGCQAGEPTALKST